MHEIYLHAGSGAVDVDGVADAFDTWQDVDEVADAAAEQFGEDAEDVAAEVAAVLGYDPGEAREKTHIARLALAMARMV